MGQFEYPRRLVSSMTPEGMTTVGGMREHRGN